MSETTTNAQDRKTILSSAADTLRGFAETIRLTYLKAGEVLTRIDAECFPAASDKDDFFQWATNVTGWSRDRVKDYMTAYAVNESLTDAGRKKVTGWPVDSLVALGPVKDAKDRGKIVRSIGSTVPQPKDVRDKRDAMVTGTGNGGSGRNRKSDADVTIELAESLEASVLKVLKDGRPEVALMIGAKSVLDLIYPGDKKAPAKYDVTLALTHLVKNSEKVRTALRAKSAKSAK